MIFLDTHVVAWLHQGSLELLSDKVKAMIDAEDLAVSPAVRLELEFLREIGRIKTRGSEILDDLRQQIDMTVADDPFDAVVRAACAIRWTRDPFDRLIVGQASARNVLLLTKDQRILENFPRAIW